MAKKQVKDELEKIYEEKYSWLKATKSLRSKINKSADKTFKKYPILKAILILEISTNIGIYLLLFLSIYHWFF